MSNYKIIEVSKYSCFDLAAEIRMATPVGGKLKVIHVNDAFTKALVEIEPASAAAYSAPAEYYSAAASYGDAFREWQRGLCSPAKTNYRRCGCCGDVQW